MAQTTTELYNLAAQVVGARGKLVSTSQASRYTDVFGLWLPYVRAIVLAAAHWPSSRKYATLGLLVERGVNSTWTNADPAPGAKYAYTAPADLLYPRSLSTGGHFSLGMLGDTKAIFAHEESPVLAYTFDQTDPGKWEPELFLLMAQALGAYTAMTLTGKPGRAQQLQAQVNDQLIRAQACSAEMQQQPSSSVASWHAARGYIGAPQVTRYVYPFGALVNIGESASVK